MHSLLYLAIAIAALVYGGQVCPFMAGLPMWEFEGYVLLPMLLVLGLRQALQPAYVDGAPRCNAACVSSDWTWGFLHWPGYDELDFDFNKNQGLQKGTYVQIEEEFAKMVWP